MQSDNNDLRSKRHSYHSDGPFDVASISLVRSDAWLNHARKEGCKVSTPDWSKAPEGATHWGPRHSEGCRGAWFRLDCDGWLVWRDIAWSLGPAVDSGVYANMIARPTQWRGPQDGLPPVGMEIEAKVWAGWEGGTVVAIVNDGHIAFAIVQHTNCWNPYAARELRPIQSDRDRAIEELIDLVSAQGFVSKDGTASKAIAQMVYDAGYRKT
jgi:hypothetical protein